MTKFDVGDDPHADLEATKYDNPVPSRQYLLDFLAQSEHPMSHLQVCRALGLEKDEQVEALRRRLIAMSRDGQVMRNRRGAYGSLDRMELVRGRVIGHRDGFGFVARREGGKDLYLSNREMRKVFDGDEVLTRITGTDRRGREEAMIVEVVARNTETLVGRFYRDDDVSFVVPSNTRIAEDVFIPAGAEGEAKAGQYVLVRISHYPTNRNSATAEVIEVLGEHLAPGMEIDVAIRAHGVPFEWPEEVTAEANALPVDVDEADKPHRVDLRHLPLVTIDGEDARDFDDAVYCETKRSGGWRLYVAIADVSHYVAVESALDQQAFVRGNSVYFPEHVVPMLPEALSNGLCSLKPQVDRLAMVCEMTISAAGRLSGYKFYEAVIHSHARLTYTQVGAWLEGAKPEAGDVVAHTSLMPHLRDLHNLFLVLREARGLRGAIDFETTETRIIFGDERKIERIVPVERNDAHKLIEECMLCANVAAARFLDKHELGALFRVHMGPPEEKLGQLREFLSQTGLQLEGGGKPKPGDYQAILSQVAERPDAHLIQTVLLRSMSQACYQVDNFGHFGLAYSAYTHFTSPIRRYADLLVHRAIRSVVRSTQESRQVQRVAGAGQLAKANIYPYDDLALAQAGEQTSMTERRADDATRDVVAFLKCEFLRHRVGEVFDGIISAVTGFGLFVELDDLYVEGLVHISNLASDYYQFDPASHRLVGERAGTVYRLGDRVRVQVAKVDLDEKKVDLDLVKLLSTTRKVRKRRRDSDEGVSGAEQPGGSRQGASDDRPAKGKKSQAGRKNKAKKPGGKRARSDDQVGGAKTAGSKNKAKKPKVKAKPVKGKASSAKAKPSKPGAKVAKAKSVNKPVKKVKAKHVDR